MRLCFSKSLIIWDTTNIYLHTENWKCSPHHTSSSPVIFLHSSLWQNDSFQGHFLLLGLKVKLLEQSEFGKCSSYSPKSQELDWNQFGSRRFNNLTAVFSNIRRDWIVEESLADSCEDQGEREGEGAKARAGVCHGEASFTPQGAAKAFLRVWFVPFLFLKNCGCLRI